MSISQRQALPLTSVDLAAPVGVLVLIRVRPTRPVNVFGLAPAPVGLQVLFQMVIQQALGGRGLCVMSKTECQQNEGALPRFADLHITKF